MRQSSEARSSAFESLEKSKILVDMITSLLHMLKMPAKKVKMLVGDVILTYHTPDSRSEPRQSFVVCLFFDTSKCHLDYDAGHEQWV